MAAAIHRRQRPLVVVRVAEHEGPDGLAAEGEQIVSRRCA